MVNNSVQIDLGANSKSLNEELAKSRSSIFGWVGGVKGALAGLAAGYALKKLFDVGAGLFTAMQDDVDALDRLKTVLSNTGDISGYTADQITQLANRAEKLNGITADSYTNIAAMAIAMENIRGENIDRMIIAAADMATVMGGDAAASADTLAKALNDPLKGLKLLEKSGIIWTEQQETMIDTMMKAGDVAGAQAVMLDELESRFGGASANAAKTFTGRLFALKETLQGVGETIVGMFIPVVDALLPPIEAAAEYLTYLAESLAESGTATESWSDSWGKYFVEMLQYGVEVAADVFSFFEFTWNNFGKLVEREALSWTLSITSFVEDLKYLFTDVAPAYLSWFFDNWANLLYDYANFQMTVYGNMWTNVTQFFKGVKGWLTGENGGFEWVALTDGFEATTKKLPEIAERNLTDFEKMLGKDIKRMDKELGKAWGETFSNNQKFVKEMFEGKAEPKIEPKVSDKAFKVDMDKLKDDAEDEAKPKVEMEVETKLGEVVGLEDLGKQISEGGKADREKQRDKAADELEKALEKSKKEAKKGLGGFAIDPDGDRKLAINVPKPAVPKQQGAVVPKPAAPVNVVGTQRGTKSIDDLIMLLESFHPQLLNALANAGGLG